MPERADVKAMAGALVEVEEQNLNLDCLSDACGHAEGDPACDIGGEVGCGDAEAVVKALNLAGWYLTRDQKDVAATLMDMFDYETEGLGGT